MSNPVKIEFAAKKLPVCFIAFDILYYDDLVGQLKHDLVVEETAKEMCRQAINRSEAEKLAAMKEIQVSDLNLSPRCYNCLTRMGITTLADLAEVTFEELTRIRNFGGKCIREVLEVCEKYGVVIDYG